MNNQVFRNSYLPHPMWAVALDAIEVRAEGLGCLGFPWQFAAGRRSHNHRFILFG